MDDAWEVLKDAGLPDGAARSRPAAFPSDRRIQTALLEVELQADKLAARHRELLLAWLQAGFHHWPRRFADLVGIAGDEWRERLRTTEAEIDRDRYLELRRIAIENLSASL